jgi:Xaa-Pro aminopeptidase
MTTRPLLTPETLPEIQRALADAGLDGWLLFDFRGLNPIALGLVGFEGFATRRWFVLVPRAGVPVAVTHGIEQGPWRDWPAAWRKERYGSWRALEELLARHLRGLRVAMEYSPGDAIPYIDRIPAGVLDLVRAAGAAVESSAELVTRFYAVLDDAQLAAHERAAVAIARVAREAMALAGERASAGTPMAEHEIKRWILDRFAGAGLETDHGPIVAAGENAANPHYEPSEERPRLVRRGEVLLIDLFAHEPGGMFADQTWMGVLGDPSDRAVAVWEAVRDARDAALALIGERVRAGEPVRGGEADDAARAVIESRGFGEYFIHRTGHSIDARELHGSGPHIDNFETREERLLVPGVAFSVEPGVYIPGEIGMRSEVNVYIAPGRAVVTPAEYQRELMVV